MPRHLILKSGLVSVSVLFVCSIPVIAQSRPANAPTPSEPANSEKLDSSEDKSGLAPMDEEMRARRAIKYAEKEYKENVERAREAAQLGAELRDFSKDGRSFGREEAKKLERLEKLAKKIRTEAGGSDEDAIITDPPAKLEMALSRLADVSATLCKTVEKTPRQVISASVIEQANVVLQLARIVRGLFH